MTMLQHGMVGSSGVDTDDIGHSLRCRSAASAYLSRTFTSNGTNTWTLSIWFKGGATGLSQILFNGGSTAAASGVGLIGSGIITMTNTASGTYATSTALLRDPTAPVHLVISNSAGTASIYVNNVLVVAGAGANNINTNLTHYIGSGSGSAYFVESHLSRICFVDGTALTPSSFGYLNTEINEWVSKSQSAVKVVVDAGGTNSFMLDFDDATSLTTLGYDKSSKGNHWTLNNFSLTAGTTYDHMLDVPGNSFATLNPLNAYPAITSRANLRLTSQLANWNSASGSIAVSSGKWYWEVVPNFSSLLMIGISPVSQNLTPAGVFPGSAALGWAYFDNGQKYNNGSGSAYGASYVANDVIGVALDMDAGTVTFYKNGVSQGVAASSLSGGYTPAIGVYNPGEYADTDFGQAPLHASATYHSASGGYFRYAPPTGFKALCQRNLPEGGTVTVSGTFTGNAAVDGPFVWINGVPKTLAINGNAVTFGTHADKTAGGFKLRTSSASYNAAGSNSWTATIDSNLQNVFKYNNAQGNP